MVILVPDALPALASGSRADVSLLIGTAAMVLTVPNSALTPLGNGQALALTLNNGVATRAVVKTGYAGTLLTQVMSGLTAGQHVALADLSTALPTNTTNSDVSAWVGRPPADLAVQDWEAQGSAVQGSAEARPQAVAVSLRVGRSASGGGQLQGPDW
jgi:hypothetical protein